MGYPEIDRRVAFAAKLEATPGTDAAPTVADDAIRLLEPPTVEEFYLAENLTDDIITGKLGSLTLAAPGARAFRIRGRAPIVGSGVAYDDATPVYPELDALLVAGGFARTVTEELVGGDGLATAEYEPSDDPTAGPNTTATAILQMEGKLYKLTYSVLEELSVTCDAAGFPVLAFSLVGIAIDPTEQVLEAAAYLGTQFPVWKGVGSLTVGAATNLKPRSMELNLGSEASPRVDANAADGHSGYRVVNRVPELRIRAEVTALTDWDPREDWQQRTTRAIVATFGNALTGEYAKFMIEADDARVIGVESSTDARFRYYDARYRLTMPAAGSELKLTYFN